MTFDLTETPFINALYMVPQEVNDLTIIRLPVSMSPSLFFIIAISRPSFQRRWMTNALYVKINLYLRAVSECHFLFHIGADK